MKVLYSELKELLPGLKATAQEVGAVLTMTGFLMDGLTQVKFRGRPDQLISLEVRQNRADCLSVLGVARELKAYYGLDLKLPSFKLPVVHQDKLKIKVEAVDFVKRIVAVQMSGLKNKTSPEWLKEYLALYDINSINWLVDLSNYVMIYTGYTSHLLDRKKIQGEEIIWRLNKHFDQITTLDGSAIKLTKKNELIICDQKNILALAGIVGGQQAAIDLNSQDIIVEMAVYDRTIIRQNSRSLKIVTEASLRLEKDLDPAGVTFAKDLLVSLILENCGGRLASPIYNYYPLKRQAPVIKFKPDLLPIYAGVEIDFKQAQQILTNLRFDLEKAGNYWLVTPPLDRMDVACQEDIIEEVIRISGYDKIPTDEIPLLAVVPDITPKIFSLTDKIRDLLAGAGLDEVLTLPLVKKGDNQLTNYQDWENVTTQNSINEEYPDLRQSIAAGLLVQLQEYLKKNVEHIGIFEIGRIFGGRHGQYEEADALGVLMHMLGQQKKLNEVKKILESLLLSLGVYEISYLPAKLKPVVANPSACWTVLVEAQVSGIFYKLKKQKENSATYVFELNINVLDELLRKSRRNPVVEITQKLIVLDANVELDQADSIAKVLNELKKKVDSDKLWSLAVHDVFPLPPNKIRYTVRATYQELSDQAAKELHLKLFNLHKSKGHLTH